MRAKIHITQTNNIGNRNSYKILIDHKYNYDTKITEKIGFTIFIAVVKICVNEFRAGYDVKYLYLPLSRFGHHVSGH